MNRREGYEFERLRAALRKIVVAHDALVSLGSRAEEWRHGPNVVLPLPRRLDEHQTCMAELDWLDAMANAREAMAYDPEAQEEMARDDALAGWLLLSLARPLSPRAAGRWRRSSPRNDESPPRPLGSGGLRCWPAAGLDGRFGAGARVAPRGRATRPRRPA